MTTRNGESAPVTDGGEQTSTVASEPLAANPVLDMVDAIEDGGVLAEAERLLLEGMDADVDVLVIGGGPGGYVAAIRAAQLGGKVVLVEGRELGGTCLNRGCIPTKAMLESVSVLHTIKKAREFGIECPDAKADFGKIMNRVQRVVKQLRSGIEFLMKKNEIQVIQGWATFKDAHTIRVDLPGGTFEEIKARNIIIAAGSSPLQVPIPRADGEGILTSDTILELTTLPASLVIVGAGAVGVEFGHVFASLGCKVTLIEMLPRILPVGDPEISEEMTKILKKGGIQIATSARVTGISDAPDGKQVQYSMQRADGGEDKSVTAQYVLMAVGRTADTKRLGLDQTGVQLERGRLAVDDHMQTSIPGVYAVGDAIRGVGLAHWASAEGVVAAENAMGNESSMGDRPIPSCIYTEPEIASVGMTEDEARAAGRDVQVGKFSLRVLGKSVAAGVREGFVKVVADAEYGRILGVHILGERATDLIAEATLALQFGATIDELAETVHPHPTFAEALAEAALAARGEAIHGA